MPCQVGELLRVLERRVDQDEAAPLLGWEQRAERFPRIALMHRDLAVPGEAATQGGSILGMQFAAGHAVGGPQQRARNRRRTGIKAE
jgi:hypothetical protein